jgi:hypothetical protein
MRRTARWTTMTTAALLALSLAPALQAQRWGDRNDARNNDRYRDRYPNSGQMERVTALAREIDSTAHYILREAERNNRRPDRDEARMLSSLRGLDQRTERYYERIGSYRRDPRRTADEFSALEAAFYQVEDTLRYVEPRGYVDRGMERIHDLMNELSRYYGRSGYGSWRDRGQDRHDDGRYGRDRDGDRNGYRRPPSN